MSVPLLLSPHHFSLFSLSTCLAAARRYGLLGPNGAGKTTLMRNIANGAIDGLPTELRTVFVQHDIVASDVSWRET